MSNRGAAATANKVSSYPNVRRCLTMKAFMVIIRTSNSILKSQDKKMEEKGTAEIKWTRSLKNEMK